MVTLPRTLSLEARISWDGSGTFVGTNDNVTSYVLGDPGVSFEEGRDSVQTLSPPKVRTADFELKNDSGRFSQDRGDSPVYQRVVPGKSVQYRARHGVRDLYRSHTLYTEHDPYRGLGLYPLGDHIIEDISQSTEIGSRRVRMSTLGTEIVLTRSYVTVPLMVSPRVDQCFTALLDAVGWPTNRRDISISDTTLALWWCDERDPWVAMTELSASEGPSSFGVRRDGTFYFENRNYRNTQSRSTISQDKFYDQSQGTTGLYRSHTPYREHDLYRGKSHGEVYMDLQYNPGFKSIFNRATYTVRSRALQSVGTIWELGSVFTLSANQTRILFARPTDPFVNAVTPAVGVDYTVTSGSATVSLVYTSGFVAFIQIVAGASGAEISGVADPTRGIKLRGQAYTLVSETYVTNTVDASDSIERFSPIPGSNVPLTISVGGWPEISLPQATGVCDAWVRRQMIPRPQVTFRMTNDSSSSLEQILRRQVSDRITLVNANTGLSDDFWINAMKLVIHGAGGRVVDLELSCEQVDTLSGALWDVDSWDVGIWGI